MMRAITAGAVSVLVLATAGRAFAGGPVPAPGAIVPTAAERASIVAMAEPPPMERPGEWWGKPPAEQPKPPDVVIVQGNGAPCSTGTKPCCTPKDECGWPVDTCGKRNGRVEILLQGSANAIGSPDGLLGEDIFIPGPQLDWNGVDYPITFGGRVGVTYFSAPDTRWEGRGTLFGNPSDDDFQTGSFASRPGNTGLGDISRPIDTTLKADVTAWTAELNWWMEVSCWSTWRFDVGAGARYVSIEEDARAIFDTAGPNPNAFPIDDGFVHSRTTNDFYGAQVMIGTHDNVNDRTEIYGTLKAMFGSIRREIKVDDLNVFTGGAHNGHLNDDEFVFGIDFEAGVKFRVARGLSLIASYDLFFLDGVQRAEDTFNFGVSNTGSVQPKASPTQFVVHSVLFGIVLDI